MNNEEIDHLLSRIKNRYEQIRHHASKRDRFLLHIESLGRWENEPLDYPSVTPEFPDTVSVAYAVCHPNCGTKELIIDGSTQECQYCGSNMFRISTKQYGVTGITHASAKGEPG